MTGAAQTSATITLENRDEALLLFGSRDQFLRAIRDALEVRLIASGDTLQIECSAALSWLGATPGGRAIATLAVHHQRSGDTVTVEGTLQLLDPFTGKEIVRHKLPAERLVMAADGKTLAQAFTIRKDPWRPVSDQDLRAQYELASLIRDQVNEANNAIITIRRMKQAIIDRQSKSQNADVKALGDQFIK